MERLYEFAYSCARFRRLPPEFEPDDLVQTAVEEILFGQREWDEERFPRIEGPLKGIIRSLLSHERARAYNRTRARPRDPEGNELDVDAFSSDGRCTLQEEELHFKRMREDIESLLDGDDGLLSVYFSYLDGCQTPREVAEALSIPIEECRNRLKRLRRKCRDNLHPLGRV